MSVRREGRFKNAGAKVENGIKRGLILSGQLVAQRATRKAPRDTGRLKRSITKGQPYWYRHWRWAIDVGTNVEYAAAQEFGHTQVITDKQRWFFRFKYKDTGDEMWRSLSYAYQYTIPMQPYLRPALADSRREIRILIFKSILGALRGT